MAAIDNLSESVTELRKSCSMKSDNEERKKIIHNGKNLLNVHAAKMSLYVRALMRILFTIDELKNGIIVENSNTSRASERTPLDRIRINKLKG